MASKTAIRNCISMYSCLKQTRYGHILIDNKISIKSEDKNKGFSTMKTVETNSLEKSVAIYQSTEGNIPENCNFQHCSKKLCSQKNMCPFPKQVSVHFIRSNSNTVRP